MAAGSIAAATSQLQCEAAMRRYPASLHGGSFDCSWFVGEARAIYNTLKVTLCVITVQERAGESPNVVLKEPFPVLDMKQLICRCASS